MKLTADEAAALDELVFSMSGAHTVEEIAERLGISRQRVSQIEQRAMARLRCALAGTHGDSDWHPGK